MKRSLSLKTLFRSWAKTVFTFILIAAVTFALFSQMSEYVNTKHEFEANVDMYYGSGMVEKSAVKYKNVQWPYYIEADPRVNCFDLPDYNELRYEPITWEQVKAIESLPYVSSTYKRYMTGGICEEIYREDDWTKAYDHAARLVVEGTFAGLKSCYYENRVIIEDCKILAGQADIEDISLEHDGYTIGASFHSYILDYNYLAAYPPVGKPSAGCMDEGNEWFGAFAGQRVTSIQSDSYIYDGNYLNSLKIGGRYVFVLRFFRQDMEWQTVSCSLYDFLTEPWCKAVWDVTDAPENYLELEEYAPLKECIEITNADIHTFDVVYADDMSVIKRVNDDLMSISEGRWLTPEDTENNAPVCVVSERFANDNDVKIGDTLSLKLGDELFEQYFALGAIAVTPERYADNWTEETELEIVGIYTDSNSATLARTPNWTYSRNTVFVPLSLLPLTEEQLEGHDFSPSEFSFQVNNAWDIEPFIEECIPKIQAMGLNVTFEDNHWLEVAHAYRNAQTLSIIRIILLCCVTVIATGFIVYLYISRKRKDYAIMRALGTPKAKSGRSLLLPLMLLGISGVAVGITLAVLQTVMIRGQVLLLPVLVCGVGEVLLILLISMFALVRIGRLSPLTLLHGEQKTKKKGPVKTAAHTAQEKSEIAGKTAVVKVPAKTASMSGNRGVQKPNNAHTVRFVCKYVLRHILRSKAKSVFAVLLAVFMSAAVIQFVFLRETYAEMEDSTVITTRFINSISLNNLQKLEKDEFAQNIYYEKTLEADIHYDDGTEEISIGVTNNIERYTNEKISIEFAQDYDESCLNKLGNVIILGEDLMESYGYELGDTVKITPRGRMATIMMNEKSKFSEEYPDLPATNEMIYQKYGNELNTIIGHMADSFTIAGVITTPSGTFSDMAFVPGKSAPNATLGVSLVLEIAEFQLADNDLAEEMQKEGMKLTKGNTGGFVMDTSKLDSVIGIGKLLNSLYPVVIAAALVIGGFLSALIIVQTSKDTAIMRIQGTTKRKTRAILAIEQILLTILGAVVGVLVMAAIKGAAFMETAEQTLVFAGVYIVVTAAAAVISAVFATHKNILELLQTKE